MKDKELRQEVENMSLEYETNFNDLTDKIECISDKIENIIKIDCAELKINNDNIERILFGTTFCDQGLVKEVKTLHIAINELIRNQQTLLDYLGLEKVEEPLKIYLKKKSK